MKLGGFGWILRVVLLLAALGGVFYAMKQLDTKGLPKDALFLNETQSTNGRPQTEVPENQQKPHAGVPEFDLCSTRVKSIQFQWKGQNYDIQNSGKSWRANAQELPPVDMEKWLVLLCRVKAERVIDTATSTQKYKFADQLVFNYVDGQALKFGLETPAFLFGDKAFYSRPFLEMVNNLKTMIGSGAPAK